jgi:outer membrane protein assembly factor BamB
VFPAAKPRPPLEVKAPVELWRKSLPNGNFMPETAFSGTHLGIVTSNQLWILDRKGNIVKQIQDAEVQSAGSGPVVDRQGNFYFVTKRASLIRPDGAVLWYHNLGPNISPSLETTASSKLLLDPQGTLYFSASDGYLYALASTGLEKWKVKVGLGKLNWGPTLWAGVGDTILMEGPNRRIADGAPVQDPVLEGRVMDLFLALPGAVIGAYVDGEVVRNHLFDRCGKLLWAFPKSQPYGWYIGLVDHDGRYLVSAGTYLNFSYYYYSASGEKLLGPKEAAGGARALGADGTIYATRCTEAGLDAVLDLFAYSPALDLLWSMSLPGACHDRISIVLADDGVLYLTRPKLKETEVIAIQTRSPGLAATGFAKYGYNNRQTGWLAPE